MSDLRVCVYVPDILGYRKTSVSPLYVGYFELRSQYTDRLPSMVGIR